MQQLFRWEWIIVREQIVRDETIRDIFIEEEIYLDKKKIYIYFTRSILMLKYCLAKRIMILLLSVRYQIDQGHYHS